jgi:hypothetical protein
LRIKWRKQYICALRKRLETIETEFELKETMSTAIAEWLETGEVNVSNYPIKYANAILSQERIGWRHFFAGKITQVWLKLQNSRKEKRLLCMGSIDCRNHIKVFHQIMGTMKRRSAW